MILWEQIREYFERDAVRFIEHDAASRVLEVDMRLTDHDIHLRVAYDEENGVVGYEVPHLDLPRRLPRNRHELRRALLLLNSCYLLGAFSENPQGRVSFGITVITEGNELPYAAHRRILRTVLVSVDRALPWLRQVAMGALAAEEAVDNIADQTRRLEERSAAGAVTPGLPSEDDLSGDITEREIEDFGRALLEGDLPPPSE